MRIVYTDGKNQDFAQLCALLDEHLFELVGDEKQRALYAPYNTVENIHDVLLVYVDEIPAACAGFKYYKEHVAELKRVFVRREYRGRGLSHDLMHALEDRAREKGYTKMILETGLTLVEAMGLYQKLNYKVIENYGQYKGMTDSICMEKEL